MYKCKYKDTDIYTYIHKYASVCCSSRVGWQHHSKFVQDMGDSLFFCGRIEFECVNIDILVRVYMYIMYINMYTYTHIHIYIYTCIYIYI